MRGRRHDQHDVVPGLQLAVTMDDEARLQRPALQCFGLDALKAEIERYRHLVSLTGERKLFPQPFSHGA